MLSLSLLGIAEIPPPPPPPLGLLLPVEQSLGHDTAFSPGLQLPSPQK